MRLFRKQQERKIARQYHLFNMKKKSTRYEKGIIALARKITTIILHQITNEEMYEIENQYKNKENPNESNCVTVLFQVDKYIKINRKNNYNYEKRG